MRINSAYSRRPLARRWYRKGVVACWRTGVGRLGRDDARATAESADSPSNNGIRRSTNPLMPRLRSFFSRVSLSFTLSFLGSFLVYIVWRFARRHLTVCYGIFSKTFYLYLFTYYIFYLFHIYFAYSTFCFYFLHLYILSQYIYSGKIRLKIFIIFSFFFFSHFFFSLLLFRVLIFILYFYSFSPILFACAFWKNVAIDRE